MTRGPPLLWPGRSSSGGATPPAARFSSRPSGCRPPPGPRDTARAPASRPRPPRVSFDWRALEGVTKACNAFKAQNAYCVKRSPRSLPRKLPSSRTVTGSGSLRG